VIARALPSQASLSEAKGLLKRYRVKRFKQVTGLHQILMFKPVLRDLEKSLGPGIRDAGRGGS
jgi:hypothetical protein